MASVIQTISKRPSISIVEDWIYTRLPTEFPKEPIKAGTRLTFVQTGVPAGRVEDLRAGWTEYYWAPMKEMLEK